MTMIMVFPSRAVHNFSEAMRPSTQAKPTLSAGCPYYYPKRMAGARAQVDTIKIPDQNAEFVWNKMSAHEFVVIFSIMNVHPLRKPNHEDDSYLDLFS